MWQHNVQSSQSCNLKEKRSDWESSCTIYQSHLLVGNLPLENSKIHNLGVYIRRLQPSHPQLTKSRYFEIYLVIIIIKARWRSDCRLKIHYLSWNGSKLGFFLSVGRTTGHHRSTGLVSTLFSKKSWLWAWFRGSIKHDILYSLFLFFWIFFFKLELWYAVRLHEIHSTSWSNFAWIGALKYH